MLIMDSLKHIIVLSVVAALTSINITAIAQSIENITTDSTTSPFSTEGMNMSNESQSTSNTNAATTMLTAQATSLVNDTDISSQSLYTTSIADIQLTTEPVDTSSPNTLIEKEFTTGILYTTPSQTTYQRQTQTTQSHDKSTQNVTSSVIVITTKKPTIAQTQDDTTLFIGTTPTTQSISDITTREHGMFSTESGDSRKTSLNDDIITSTTPLKTTETPETTREMVTQSLNDSSVTFSTFQDSDVTTDLEIVSDMVTMDVSTADAVASSRTENSVIELSTPQGQTTVTLGDMDTSKYQSTEMLRTTHDETTATDTAYVSTVITNESPPKTSEQSMSQRTTSSLINQSSTKLDHVTTTIKEIISETDRFTDLTRQTNDGTTITKQTISSTDTAGSTTTFNENFITETSEMSLGISQVTSSTTDATSSITTESMTTKIPIPGSTIANDITSTNVYIPFSTDLELETVASVMTTDTIEATTETILKTTFSESQTTIKSTSEDTETTAGISTGTSNTKITALGDMSTTADIFTESQTSIATSSGVMPTTTTTTEYATESPATKLTTSQSEQTSSEFATQSQTELTTSWEDEPTSAKFSTELQTTSEDLSTSTVFPSESQSTTTTFLDLNSTTLKIATESKTAISTAESISTSKETTRTTLSQTIGFTQEQVTMDDTSLVEETTQEITTFLVESTTPEKSALSTGAIVGICIGAAVFIILLIIIILLLLAKRKSGKYEFYIGEHTYTNPTYDSGDMALNYTNAALVSQENGDRDNYDYAT